MKFKVVSGENFIIVKASVSLVQSLVNSDFSRKYIPDSRIIECNEEVADIGLTIIEDVEDLNFSFNQGHGILKCYLNKNISLEAVIVVIDYCLEYQRQKKGVFCIHGSAVSLNGKGILILGGVSGLGKTTLALNLCLKHKAKFIGDDKIIVDENGLLVGGVKKIEFNKTVLFKSVGSELNNKDVDELNKIIQVEEEKMPICIVVQPTILPKADFELERWNINKASFHFYEELSRKIRGSSKRINNSTFPLASVDTQEISLLRSNFVNTFTKKVPFISIKGDLYEVMNNLIRYVE